MRMAAASCAMQLAVRAWIEGDQQLGMQAERLSVRRRSEAAFTEAVWSAALSPRRGTAAADSTLADGFLRSAVARRRDHEAVRVWHRR